jgi:hypothetical protein
VSLEPIKLKVSALGYAETPSAAAALTKRSVNAHIRAITRPILRDWRIYVFDFRSALEMLALAVSDLLGHRVFVVRPRLTKQQWSTEMSWMVEFRPNRLGRASVWLLSKLRRR